MDAYDAEERTLVSHLRGEGRRRGLLSVLFERSGRRGGRTDAHSIDLETSGNLSGEETL